MHRLITLVIAVALCCFQVARAAAPIPVDEVDSHLTISFAETHAASGAAKFCFAVAADRACDPATSACCSARSPTKKLGLREFHLGIDPRCATPSALARIGHFEWAVGPKRVKSRYDANNIAVRVAGAFPVNASLCVVVPESEAGQPCTTPAELCGGSGQACDLRVVTLPFKQYGSASGAKRACIVKADVAIGPQPVPPVPSPEPASPTPSPPPPEPSRAPAPSPAPMPYCNEWSLSGATAQARLSDGSRTRDWGVDFFNSVTQRWTVGEGSKQVSLGNFARFDRESCRWRFGGGAASSDCTPDEYGQRRRRGWINLMCNPRLNERAKLVAVQEPMLCEYALTVETPEVCPPPRKACNDSSLKGATAQGSFDLGGYGRNFTVDFNQSAVVQAWKDWQGLHEVSLGAFAFFLRDRCSWRIENGTDDPTCTPDDFGQRRRRAWVNLKCDETIGDARAAVVAATEPAACAYYLTVASAELCGP